MDNYSAKNYDESQSVGVVRPQVVGFNVPFVCANGVVLPTWELSYETYGTLNADCSNAVLVCHALSGSQHAAGFYEDEPNNIGWWDNFIGPNKPIDTTRFFVISPNNLGGCHGSTGPRHPHPDDGRPYGSRFPIVTVEDWVRSQKKLIEVLGIKKLFAVVGGSLGGMQALRWAIDYPNALCASLIIAASARLSASNIAFNEIARHSITGDKNFSHGDFYDYNEIPEQGLSVARMIGHVTYLSNNLMTEKFGRERQEGQGNSPQFNYDSEFQVESYLRHQGKKFAKKFDANTYLLMTKALDYFDPAQDANGDLVQAVSPIMAPCFLLSFSSDSRFPPDHSRHLVKALLTAKKEVSYMEIDSGYGHDSFLLANPTYHEAVAAYMQQLWESVNR